MDVIPNPFYLDWSFWAVTVASIALVLSQLPPIHILLKKAKIDFELYSKISLLHKVGNPNLQIHIIINNIGGRKVRIKNIESTVIRDGNKVAILPAQNYLEHPSDKNTVLFTSFPLNPGDEFGHIVNLLRLFSREEEREYRDLEGKLKSDIFEKQALINGKQKELIEASPENVEPFHKFFTQHFIWSAGEYELKIKVITDNESTNIEKNYRFTLFEYYEEELRKIKERYKYGDGIYWDSDVIQSAIIDIKEA